MRLRRFDEKKALDEVIWKLIFDNAELYARVAALERRVSELERRNKA